MSIPFDPNRDAVKQFSNELLAVFTRWFEESDLDEFDMECAATDVIEGFCGTTLGFDSDIDLDEEDYD
jgi:hypothetical protein